MKIHSDTLTESQLYTAKRGLPVYLETVCVGSRSRNHGFLVRLSADRDDLHRRAANSGQYGASSNTIGEVAATWDDWGVWIARLFLLDPNAIIGPYKGRNHFYAETTNFVESSWYHRRYVEEKPKSLYARTHTAPWLCNPVTIPTAA